MRRKNPVPPDQQDHNTGSPRSGEPVYLVVGKLRRPHGVKGEMLMEVITSFPERLRARKTVYVGDEHAPMRLTHVRRQDTALLVCFEGLEDVDAVAHLRNQMVYVKAENLPALPEGEYYHHQLLGLQVVDEGGRPLGFLSEILETGANDVYLVINPEGEELLLPAIEDVILEVNLDRREMRVRPPEWL